LVLAGEFVFIFGRLLVAVLELVPDVSGGVLVVFWLQPTSVNAARMVIVANAMIDFIKVKDAR